MTLCDSNKKLSETIICLFILEVSIDISRFYGAKFKMRILEWSKALEGTNPSKAFPYVISILFSLLIKSSIGLFGFSGMNTPPLYGDFEAQRHWLEICVNLPVSEWYFYDLEYWGLDYPPLTAFHSWILGQVARLMDPHWTQLVKSRGCELPGLITFMRTSSIVTDLLILCPATLYFVHTVQGTTSIEKHAMFLMISLMPCLVIIDHGHFQYNSAMLGFSLLAFSLMINNRPLLASIAFCLSLAFKQMALFYALPVFFFLLGTCLNRPLGAGISRLLQIAIVVVVTWAALLAPFGSVDGVLQIFKRIFPVQRGLYEDKVANVWCALSILVKLRQIFQLQNLIYLRYIQT